MVGCLLVLGVVAQHDGEKDSRTPNDFTNNPNAKLDEGDDDDADADELEPVLARGTAGGIKKGGGGGGDAKPKIESGSKVKPSTNKNISDVSPPPYRSIPPS